MKLLRILDPLIKPSFVLAHCDVPCGIYEVKPAQIAAATVAKMVDKILHDLPKDDPSVENRNLFVRAVLTKEEHARKCKEELFILWADFFKAEHLEIFPDLHDKFWNAVKLCSKNKQSVDESLAADLVAAVDEIAEMFAKAKASAKK